MSRLPFALPALLAGCVAYEPTPIDWTKEAAALSEVTGAFERIWLRILPSLEGLRMCLDAGFPAKHIICMQGPFSEELNEAMFRACGAQILLTKDTGSAGGFPEKLAAAKKCGMKVFVIKRPEDSEGESLDYWKDQLISWRSK